MRAAVLILNWNRWPDTLECLESVFRSEGVAGPVIVCDNDSEDGSLSHLQAWADGRLDVWVPGDNPLREFSYPPVPKPIPYVEYDRDAAQRAEAAQPRAALVFIRTGGNLGFAGGNNVGLRYVLAQPDIDCVWILNNDTVVRPDALRELVRELESDPRIGVCGSTLLYYDHPQIIQALGGASYNPWLALPRHIGQHGSVGTPRPASEVRARMAYVAGASMLVTREFLQEVGLLSEDYFLYFEELDWVLRAEARFRLGYAPGSVVYHKEGRSAGTAGADRKSRIADYYFLRNRIAVTRRYFPGKLPTVYAAMVLALFNRIRRRQWDRIGLILNLWRGS
jgi:hypothetical protein